MWRVFFVVVLLSVLPACAPMSLTRTAEVTPVGETKITATIGYPVWRTTTDVCSWSQGDFQEFPLYPGCLSMGAKPDYWPYPQPITILSAWGTAPGHEQNLTYMVTLAPGVRYGGKSLLHDGTFKLAADYGASLGVFGIGHKSSARKCHDVL